MFKKIMFPTDFSTASNRIYSYIESFKDIGMEDALLVHVVDTREGADIRDRSAWATDALNKERELLEVAGIRTKTVIRAGIPFVELNDTAEKEDVSLVILASHGKSMVERMFLGSVTEKLIYHSTKPVLIEKRALLEDYNKESMLTVMKDTFKHILYPTDWSDCAKDVLERLKSFKEFGTEMITVLHVMDTRHLKYHTESKIKEFERVDIEKLNEVEAELKEHGFNVKVILTVGTPFAEIKRAARESDVTLVAMGVHGKGFIKEMLLGSTAEKVAKHAFKPVLLLSHIEEE